MYGLLTKKQLDQIILSVCDVLGNGSNNNAHLLLSETANAETSYGDTPDTSWSVGVGIMQFDKIGFDDTRDRTSQSKKDLIKKVYSIDIDKLELNDLRYNPLLSVIFTRLFYLLRSGSIPTDIIGRANYWKKYYNSIEGAGTIEHYLEANKEHRFLNV